MYKSMSEIREKNKSIDNYFFSKDTMRFFKSKIETGVLKDKYFITSEINPSDVKKYTIREATEEGEIKTVGDFHSFTSVKQAKQFLPS